ncbi:MAG TPA: hypothetical protein VMW25_05105 [Clostridia bacterium]|nr:hypothetical protein [Clostridia bacterium]
MMPEADKKGNLGKIEKGVRALSIAAVLTAAQCKSRPPTAVSPEKGQSDGITLVSSEETIPSGAGEPSTVPPQATETPHFTPIKIVDLGLARGNGLAELEQTGEAVTPGAEKYIKAWNEGKTYSVNGERIAITEGRANLMGCLNNRTGEVWPVIIVYNEEEEIEHYFLPTEIKTGEEEEMFLVKVFAKEGERIEPYPDYGVVVKEPAGDQTNQWFDSWLYPKGKVEVLSEEPLQFSPPEKFRPTLQILAKEKTAELWQVPVWVNKGGKFVPEVWDASQNPAAVPEDFVISAMGIREIKEWVRGSYLDPQTGQAVEVYFKWNDANCLLRGDGREIKILEGLPAGLLNEVVERPAWVVEVSNTEVRYNQEKDVWEYYSTAEGEKGDYIVSVKPNEEGGCYFHNFAEEADVVLHPEVLSDATFNEIIEAMKKTGAVKYIPCSREGIRKLRVQTYPKFNNDPLGLIIYPNSYPLEVYYPYLKGGQANPGYPLMAIILADVNQGKPGWETRWVQVYTLDNSEKARVMTPDESKVGSGVLAKAGTLIMKVQSGLVKILGRQEKEYDDPDNRMLLDSFARNKNGKLMVPKTQTPSK